jgi:hypothetical protein
VGDKMNVLVQAEPIDPSVKIAAMKIGFYDANGKGNTLDPASALTTFPITTLVPVGVGQYRIRVAATDSTGKSGACRRQDRHHAGSGRAVQTRRADAAGQGS